MTWVDNAKILATFAVILLHVSGGYQAGISDLDSPYWWVANFYNSLVRWCVPVFVMVSGLLLLDPEKNESLSEFYKRRAARILIPLVFWTIVYLAWLWLAISLKGGDVSIEFFAKRVLTGTPYYHMWFLYMIAGLYLVTPFLRMIVRQASRKEIAYLTAALFALSAINYAINKFNPGGELLFINWFLFYLPYYFAGYLVGTANGKQYRWGLVIVFALSILLTAISCYLLAKSEGVEVGKYFYGYLSITVIPMSVALMFLLKSFTKPIAGNVVSRNLAQFSLGVYLVHPLFIDILPVFGVSARLYNPVVSIPLVTVLVFGLSLLAAQIIYSVPYVKKVI